MSTVSRVWRHEGVVERRCDDTPYDSMAERVFKTNSNNLFKEKQNFVTNYARTFVSITNLLFELFSGSKVNSAT